MDRDLSQSLVQNSASAPGEANHFVDPAQTQAFFQDVHAIADALTRLANHLVPAPADIVDTTYIANRLGCSIEWISQQAKQGRIPKSCLVEGTGKGKPWKFRRRQVDEWISNR